MLLLNFIHSATLGFSPPVAAFSSPPLRHLYCLLHWRSYAVFGMDRERECQGTKGKGRLCPLLLSYYETVCCYGGFLSPLLAWLAWLSFKLPFILNNQPSIMSRGGVTYWTEWLGRVSISWMVRSSLPSLVLIYVCVSLYICSPLNCCAAAPFRQE